MNKLKKVFFLLTFYLISANGITEASEIYDFKGQLSFNYLGVDEPEKWQNLAVLRYIPDFTLHDNFSHDYLWAINASAIASVNYQSYPESELSSEASFYRLNAQLKTSQSDTVLGLQTINFGPAIILRSLRWFDEIKPTDPLALTEGVKGIRYRYFFSNNANVWLWALYGNNDPKGYELVGTKENTVEAGARFQYPLKTGELGFTFHTRKTDGLAFSDTPVDEDLIEKRYALDGKWDLGLGIWYEFVLIDQGTDSQINSNWFKTLTLGADYTFAIGNGIHIMLEHLVNTLSEKAMTWDERTQTSALQLRYPIGILDAVSLMEIYSWTQSQGFHYLRWDRAYDNWAFSLGIFSAPNQSSNNSGLGPSGIYGNGLQFVIAFNH